jgi:DNA excision repair protein ERCC-2
MAVLYPAVKQSLKLGKKLFFLTSKTLQQDAAVKALELLNDGSFRVLRIRSKQKMCAHTEMICHEDFCPFAAKYSEKMGKSGLLTNIVTSMSYFDPDITFELAKSTEVCPFEVSLELIEQADVIVCDYNYIFDPYVGLKTYTQEKDYSDCVLVVDEAHNLVDRGRSYYSPELHEKSFEEVRMQFMSRNCWIDGWEELLAMLRDHIRDLAEVLVEDGRDDIKQALCEPSRELFMEQRTEWERIVLEYIGWKIDNRIAEEDDPIIDFYFKLVKFTNMLAKKGDEFAHIIERTPEGLRLKVFCKDPSRSSARSSSPRTPRWRCRRRSSRSSSIAKRSAFPTTARPSSRCRRRSRGTTARSWSCSEVDTTYKRRADHYDVSPRRRGDRGRRQRQFPGALSELRVPARDRRAHAADPQARDGAAHRHDRLRAQRDPRHPRDKPRRGNLILAVSGGMYAEGVDYQGDMLSGVMVVGPALPQVSFEQELLKRITTNSTAPASSSRT